MVLFVIDDLPRPAVVHRHLRTSRRLRLEVPGLRGDAYLARRLDGVARTWPGVEEVEADARSGRMLLRYSPGAPMLSGLREESELPRAPTRRRAPSSPPDGTPWHAMTPAEVVSRLGSDRHGLSTAEAQRRLAEVGPNLQQEQAPRSKWAVLGGQVLNVPMGVLLASAGLSAALGDVVEAGAILVVVGANAAIGYRIERRNEALVASWRTLEAGMAEVLRDSALKPLPAMELVPGDVILVRAGDRIPADARVLDTQRLACDEAPLTGEAEPQEKSPEPVDDETPLADRRCMLYAGTDVASGYGRAMVVATGARTELAQIRGLVERQRAPVPPLARRLTRLDRKVAAWSVGAATVTAIAHLAHAQSPLRVLRSSVALGVAALPEGLPLVATAALLRAMQRLHARGMVVRRMAGAEALGGVTVICADKTGTLTLNEMNLETLEIGRTAFGRRGLPLRTDPAKLLEDPATLALTAAVLNSDVDVHQNGHGWEFSGSPTECALVSAAVKAGLDPKRLRRRFPREELRERTEGVHYVVSVHRTEEGSLRFIKGAPEQVIQLCTRTLEGPLDDAERARLLERNQALAADGLRVLAIGFARGDSEEDDDYTFIGLVGLRDVLREGAADSIRLAQAAGVRTLVLTGDQRATAATVTREVGLSGDTLLPSELTSGAPSLDRVAAVARVTPEDKVAIVRALRERGEIVAMVGDGINDAPALRTADVGIAVGHGATDLARQVADVVMSSEDLRHIIAAVGEGRIVQDNLRRSLRFLFATNLSEMMLVLGASVLGLRDPLTPLQLLWINLLTDTLPGLALALEPGDPEVLDRPPAPPDAPLMSRREVRRVLRDAAKIAALGGGAQVLFGRDAGFSALIAAQLAYASTCRAPGDRRANPEVQRATRRFRQMMAGAFSLQVAGLLLPPLRSVLGLRGSPWIPLGALVVGAAFPLVSPSRLLEVAP